MSLLEHKKLDDGKYELSVAIDAADFMKAVEKVYHRENKKISIQGFRKGKAPRAIIEKMYGEGFFYEDALNDLLPEEFEKAVDEAKIEIVGRPEVDVDEVGKDKDAKVKFTVTLRPELTVKKYKGIAATKKVNTVEDDDVASEIDALREKGSRMVTVDDRAAQDGDITVIDFEGFKDGVAFEGGKGERFELTLGSGQFIPGFEEQIVGHKIGEDFDINVKFPEEYGAEELAGKDVVFKIKLHEIRFKELPAVDDEFAKDVSEFDTLEELKKSIIDRLTKANEDKADHEVEDELVEAMSESVEGDIPEVMIEERMDEMVHDFEYRIQAQGMNMKTYLQYMGMDMENFRKSFRESAEKFVKTRLTLEAVVRSEKIEVVKEEIEKEYARLAEAYKMEVEKIKSFVPEKEMIKDLSVNKAIDLVKESAKIKVENVTKEILKKEAEKKAKEAKAKAEAKDASAKEDKE